MAIFVKDPDAKLDYGFDWDDGWLDSGETLVASTWAVPTGLTKVSDSFDDTTTVVWLSGGTEGSEYKVTNHITSSAGREEDRSHTIKMREK